MDDGRCKGSGVDLHFRHYSRHTESSYVMWCKQFVRFHRLRHPREMGEEEVSALLKHLCVDRDVAAATHNQALTPSFFSTGR